MNVFGSDSMQSRIDRFGPGDPAVVAGTTRGASVWLPCAARRLVGNRARAHWRGGGSTSIALEAQGRPGRQHQHWQSSCAGHVHSTHVHRHVQDHAEYGRRGTQQALRAFRGSRAASFSSVRGNAPERRLREQQPAEETGCGL